MLSITTDSFIGYSLDRAFALTAAAGFDGIEVSVRHSDYDTHDTEYLQTLSRRHKLPIIAVSAPENSSPGKAVHTVELALAVGAKIVTLTPPDLLNFQYKKWVREELRSLRKKKKMQIALINAPYQTILGILPRYSLNNTAEMKELPAVALDTSNVASKGEPLLELYSTLRPNIVHLYLANAKDEHDHLLPSNGNLPLESLLTRLARDKYSGAITLRLNPKALGVGDTTKVLRNLAASQKFVQKYLRS